MEKKVTIYQIAKEAGVSVSTVSRVLTGNVKVSEERRKKIQAIIDKYDYHPNSMARSLSNQKSSTIGVVLPDITHPFFNHVFYGAEAEAIQRDYTLLLGCTMNDRRENNRALESKYLGILQEKQVDGMIIMGGSVNETMPLKQHSKMLERLYERMPVVTINDSSPHPKAYHVSVNDDNGTAAIVNYLVTLRHKNFAYIGGDLSIQPTLSRLNSLKKALEVHNISFDNDNYIPGGFSVDSGKECMAKLLQRPKLPTAVLCLNDLVAIGAIYTARKAGLRIPDDMSIAGSDNLPMSEYVTPSITTIDLRAQEVGQHAIKLLIDAIEGKAKERQIHLDTRLVIRDSCRLNDSK